MRAPWRLAISSLSQRRSRSVLLLLVVVLSAALVSAVATAMNSVTESLRARMVGAVGSADLKIIVPGSARPLEEALASKVRRWPEVRDLSGRLRAAASLRAVRPVWPAANGARGPIDRNVRSMAVNVYLESFRPGFDEKHRPVVLAEGRMPAAPEEIAIDQTALDRLRGIESRAGRRSGTLSALISGTAPQVGEGNPEAGQDLGPLSARDEAEARMLSERYRAAIGQTIELLAREGESRRVRIVGVAPSGVLGGRPRAWMTPESLAEATGQQGKFAEIEIVLGPAADPETTIASHRAEIPEDAVLQSTAKVTSRLEENLKGGQVGLAIASTLAFLSAAFIILTGLTTGVVERQRELAVLRCIGASRGQIAGSQILVGLWLGVAGSLIGVPMGIGLASLVIWWFRNELSIDLAFSWFALAIGAAGSIFAGVAGAAIPAWNAARMEPLRALTARGRPARSGLVGVCAVICVVMLGTHLAVVTFCRTPNLIFFAYIFLGLPCMFVGYFLFGVPVTAALSGLLARPIARALAVPPSLLLQSLRRTPYRHGLTAGSLMAGLAMMIAIWTQGASFARDWLGKMQFPDAFVTGLALTDESVARLRGMKGITGATPLSVVRVETGGNNAAVLRNLKTTFIGFEPDTFFPMMNIGWVAGSREEAQPRLNRGDSIIVAREFAASKGVGLGDKVEVRYQGRVAAFEIVGIVTSPGLDVVSNYFDLGDMYVDQAVSAVFGSRAALENRLLGGNPPPTQLISMSLAPGTDDAAIAGEIRKELLAAGVLDVGTGRTLKNVVHATIERSLYVVSVIALMSMLVASLGVANLIVAAIEGRKFEFGVLRAIGASRWMVCRLVLAEAIVVALAACVLGTMMGVQGSYGGVRLNAVIAGIELTLRPPPGAIAAGCGILFVLAVLAAMPAVYALSRRQPRELLSAMKG